MTRGIFIAMITCMDACSYVTAGYSEKMLAELSPSFIDLGFPYPTRKMIFYVQRNIGSLLKVPGDWNLRIVAFQTETQTLHVTYIFYHEE